MIGKESEAVMLVQTAQTVAAVDNCQCVCDSKGAVVTSCQSKTCLCSRPATNNVCPVGYALQPNENICYGRVF